MLVEFLDRVVALADERRRPQVLKPEQEPEHVYLLTTPNGGVQRHRAEPKPRRHLASSLGSLADVANTMRSSPACAWYSRKEVVLLLDDTDRRDSVSLALTLSYPLRALQGLETNRTLWFSQKDFINFLRIDLAGCLGAAGNLLAIVRQLKFRQLAQSAGDIQHGKASLGKAIEAELTGAGSLPEQVVLHVPVFLNLLLPTQPVLCALDIDPTNEKLALIPLPGTLEQALRGAESAIAEQLAVHLAEHDMESVPVYYGQWA